jgi:hypothetical protein
MTEDMLRKSLIIGIIVVFIGASVTSSMGGYIGEIKTQSTIETPLGAPLNNDYMIANWMFDDCSGSILEDSSVYDHDGTIYGADWVAGLSGCALDFDGIDDYVNLDVHSEDFGFNKTDDLLFSFSFQTISTDKGIIYSTCRGDTYGYNPGFHIALLPNGSIQVQVWRLNCGILISSGGSYNDGSWHQAEILYNGISAKPIIDIYVDDVLIYSYEKYICNFYSDQFKYTNIGRHSHDLTDYYERNIDEFKIFKYTGGNEQNPPDISGPTSGAPGVEYEYNFVADDPEGDDIWYFVDWGDTTYENWFGPFPSGTEVTVSHLWANEGTYEIRAQTKDIWSDSRTSDPYYVSIGNAPPDKPTISGPASGGVDGIYGYNIVSTEPDGDDIYYYFDWGDGTNSGWDGPYSSGQTATIYNSWTSPGTYEIKGKAKDNFNAESYWSDSIFITITENDPPTIPTIQGPSNGKVGTPITYTFTSTDPDGDQVAYYIDWADGTPASWSNYYDSGQTYTASHTWNTEGAYTIKAKAKDSYNTESDWGTYTVTVPRNKVFHYSMFFRYLDNFPLLQLLLDVIWGV